MLLLSIYVLYSNVTYILCHVLWKKNCSNSWGYFPRRVVFIIITIIIITTIIIIIIIIKRGRQCKAERVMSTLSVRGPQSHNANL